MIRIPTDGELAILKVLWRDGPATVRQIHDGLEQATAYTISRSPSEWSGRPDRHAPIFNTLGY